MFCSNNENSDGKPILSILRKKHRTIKCNIHKHVMLATHYGVAIFDRGTKMGNWLRGWHIFCKNSLQTVWTKRTHERLILANVYLTAFQYQH